MPSLTRIACNEMLNLSPASAIRDTLNASLWLTPPSVLVALNPTTCAYDIAKLVNGKD